MKEKEPRIAGINTQDDSFYAGSDEWLRDKNTREKGFSLGAFREDYVTRWPAAVVKRADIVIAEIIATLVAGEAQADGCVRRALQVNAQYLPGSSNIHPIAEPCGNMVHEIAEGHDLAFGQSDEGVGL